MIYGALIFGGALGALLRLLTGLLLPFGAWTTLGINGLGCLLLGFFLPYTAGGRLPEPLRLGISAGVLGGFTTFSTFSVETLSFLHKGLWLQAALYAAGSLVGGVCLAWCGTLAARKARKAGGVS
ncbi:CrcB protein [Tumebacillus sp. BK434]|uniref:fluoride efflux transporter FluC n=1 Tax=Tumebacillus sp. BK434 TaxID=2512169 RepID=UPI001049E544|nr:CrcB family protein [Tumebacillus sp. BK434]TCP55967.1 CrcB protein [Tumebacillus sp. BK434]